MITLTSSTQSAQEMREALEAHGQQVVTDGPTVEGTEKTSEQSTSPGESSSGSTGETATTTPEVEGKTTQDTQEPAPEETAGEGHPETKFEPRRKQLEKRIERLHEDLDTEKGDKARLKARLEATEAELVKFKPVEAPKVEELARPKRPTKSDAEYDEDKLDQMMAEYEVKLDEYHIERSKKTAAEAVATERQRLADEESAREQQKAVDAFNTRLSADAKSISDYDELLSALPENALQLPSAVEASILRSDHPGRLFRHYMNDVVNNDAKEFNRLVAMDPVDQVRVLAKLEDKLDLAYVETPAEPAKPKAETKPAPAPAKAAAAAEVAPEVPVPAKRPPKQVADSDEPIQPVGSRSGASVATLAGSTSTMDYIRRRQAGVNRA